MQEASPRPIYQKIVKCVRDLDLKVGGLSRLFYIFEVIVC